MSESAQNPHILRFGVFEVDLQAGELRKSGVKIKLQDQPFQILVLLLERPGQVLTREELRQKLWSADTFVEFDHSLNSAVKRLRQALGDDSDNPRFIETLPRRGYRLIVPVPGTRPCLGSARRTSPSSQARSRPHPLLLSARYSRRSYRPTRCARPLENGFRNCGGAASSSFHGAHQRWSGENWLHGHRWIANLFQRAITRSTQSHRSGSCRRRGSGPALHAAQSTSIHGSLERWNLPSDWEQ